MGHVSFATLETGIENPLELGGFGVVLRHLRIRPPEDRHQLMFGCAGFSEDRRGRLSKAVRRAFRQVGIIAPLAHLARATLEQGSLAARAHRYDTRPGRRFGSTDGIY